MSSHASPNLVPPDVSQEKRPKDGGTPPSFMRASEWAHPDHPVVHYSCRVGRAIMCRIRRETTLDEEDSPMLHTTPHHQNGQPSPHGPPSRCCRVQTSAIDFGGPIAKREGRPHRCYSYSTRQALTQAAIKKDEDDTHTHTSQMWAALVFDIFSFWFASPTLPSSAHHNGRLSTLRPICRDASSPPPFPTLHLPPRLHPTAGLPLPRLRPYAFS